MNCITKTNFCLIYIQLYNNRKKPCCVHYDEQSRMNHHPIVRSSNRSRSHRDEHQFQSALFSPFLFTKQIPARHAKPHHQNAQFSKVMKDMLELHNYYRARHCARPLVISQRLNQIAQSYAEYLAVTSKFEHSHNELDGEPLGENLYMSWISAGRVEVDGKVAVQNWYDEIDMYNFFIASFSKKTGHFTQLVWKNSKKLGLGVALSPDKREVYYVANYYPAGNIAGLFSFRLNVSRAKC